jgi:hypothetical protein
VAGLGIWGYSVVRSFGSADRAATNTARRDPMARYTPPGATLISDVLLPSTRPSTRRAATVNRTFDVPQAQAATALKVTWAAARAAGWRINERAGGPAYGDRPRKPGARLQISLSEVSPEAGVRHLFVTVESDVI